MKIQDAVVFNAAVIRRCLHDSAVVNFSGVIERFEAGGKLAVIAVDGGGSRTVPVANLAHRTRSYGVMDLTN